MELYFDESFGALDIDKNNSVIERKITDSQHTCGEVWNGSTVLLFTKNGGVTKLKVVCEEKNIKKDK